MTKNSFFKKDSKDSKDTKKGKYAPPKIPKKLRNNPGMDKKLPKKDGDQQWKKITKTLGLWVFLIIGSIFLSQLFQFDNGNEAEITYSEYKTFLKEKKILKIVVIETEVRGELREPSQKYVGDKLQEYSKFKVILPYIEKDIVDEWDEYGLNYTFKQRDIDWIGYLLNMLPWILLIVIWVFILRRMQGGGTKGIFSFGKSKAKLMIENKPEVTFNDVAGADEAKEELEEIIEFLKSPIKFQRLGGKIPKGALLLGPPGTGKTLLARAVAGEAGVPFFSMSGADFVEMFVGVGASRVRDLFEQGKKHAPCIIFIDEIDAVGRHRGAGLGGGHDEREQTLNQLLVEMDGFEHNEGVILIAATNRPDVLDKALLRPGRFDRQIVVDRPDMRGREGILRVHSKNIPLEKDVDLKTIAKGTPGFAGAELANLVNEAALLAARKDREAVTMFDFEDAKDKVLMGVERKSMIIQEDEKKSTAYHESGHVLVAKLIPESDPIHKVTIIPRGRALGVTSSLPLDDRHNYSKPYCKSLLAKMLGGRSAEMIVFNQLTTGAGNDIEQATNLSRKMVCEWGMSDKIGPLTFGKKSEEIFIGREIAQHRDYSERTAQIIDDEVKHFVNEAEVKATKILKSNIDMLHKIANKLLQKEMLDGNEIDELMNKKKKGRYTPRKRPVKPAATEGQKSGDDKKESRTKSGGRPYIPRGRKPAPKKGTEGRPSPSGDTKAAGDSPKGTATRGTGPKGTPPKTSTDKSPKEDTNK